MSDVIIAVVPAKGREGLTAEGPPISPGASPERPALVYRCGCGQWGHFGCASLLSEKRQVALVLHAPGDPRLGMVRLMEALGVIECFCKPSTNPDDGDDWPLFSRRTAAESMARHANVARPPPLIVSEVSIMPPQRSALADAYAIAHLAVQRGLVSEVLVLPVAP